MYIIISLYQFSILLENTNFVNLYNFLFVILLINILVITFSIKKYFYVNKDHNTNNDLIDNFIQQKDYYS